MAASSSVYDMWHLWSASIDRPSASWAGTNRINGIINKSVCLPINRIRLRFGYCPTVVAKIHTLTVTGGDGEEVVDETATRCTRDITMHHCCSANVYHHERTGIGFGPLFAMRDRMEWNIIDLGLPNNKIQHNISLSALSPHRLRCHCNWFVIEINLSISHCALPVTLFNLSCKIYCLIGYSFSDHSRILNRLHWMHWLTLAVRDSSLCVGILTWHDMRSVSYLDVFGYFTDIIRHLSRRLLKLSY